MGRGRAASENVFTGTAMARRSGYMYGHRCPTARRHRSVAGAGRPRRPGVGLIAPTLDVRGTGQEETVDGVRIVFQLTPGTEAPAEMNFHFPQLRVLCVAGEAGRLLLRWEFTDTGENWTLPLSNGALTPIRGDAPRGERPVVTLRLARTTLDAVLGGRATFADEIAAGTVVLDGDAGALLTFGGLLDAPDPDFAIVTP